jgi:hypothetical protein
MIVESERSLNRVSRPPLVPWQGGTSVAQDSERPTGVAVVTGDDVHGGRAYLCDRQNHCIDVVGRDSLPIFSFGGHGSGPCRFDTPTDVAVVWLDHADADARALSSALLVVTDRNNHRIQIFETDGVPVATIDGRTGGSAPSTWPARAGWPYFRLASAVPKFSFPTRLAWHAPFLEITCAGGSVVRFDLAMAMLPDFETFLEWAPGGVINHALQDFTNDPSRSDIPDACLLAMTDRVQLWEETMGNLRP